MITIIYSTHKDKKYNDIFKGHLLDTVGLKNVEVLEYQNNNEYGLAQIYNKGIKESKFDILVCCHNEDRKSTRLNSSHVSESRMPSSA